MVQTGASARTWAPFAKREDMDFTDRVLERLRGQVFHLTAIRSYEKILSVGFIDTNEDSRHSTPFGFPSSYGRQKGYVCLFDLRTASDDDIRFAHPCLPFTCPHQLGDAAAYITLAPEAYPLLVDQKAAIRDVGPRGARNWVPRIECWYPGRLPIELTAEVLTVDFTGERIESTVANTRLHRMASPRGEP